ncbi:heme acquisition protein HasA [Yersinia mollaretii]|uniref:heme acquisition protein HasA n=1 Tax=Yersinia mollaretii TaxID=33060 RepID=UPI0005DB83E7|nr:heme acquisition protein HasA [Yersinia mollaretii]MDA5528905.1 heme acquisition hemophore HasA [Yersinia mollaretii]MDR7875477.1 heme acquisition protein HasA [Yersinia mollaretii]PHZ30064.1 heme acquisition hemophore HasA [Yersinia mollaretii]WQC75174.1 heme acquisition protein HasA [Yersinia mollaretii]CNF25617.1 hemophore HasA [Yersinia mollaretii]
MTNISIKYSGSDHENCTLANCVKNSSVNIGNITETTQPQVLAKMYVDFTVTVNSSDYSGYQYILVDSATENDAVTVNDAVTIVEGDLKSSILSYRHNKTFSGKIDSVTLGDGLMPIPGEFVKQVEVARLKLSGLDITSDFDSNKTTAENQQGEVHKVIDGLMQGNADPLLAILQAKGIDINTPLKDMAIASQFDTTSEVLTDAPIIDVIGITDGFDSAMLMAA